MRIPDRVLIREGPAVSLICVAVDSFGVKGMCVRIETPDLTVTVDPGVSPQTAEFPLPEERRKELQAKYTQAVIESCIHSQAIVISHYHLDHFLSQREPRVYTDKIIFAKDIADLPQKQQETAQRFFRAIDGLPKEIIWADGRRFKFKRTEIGFSPPLWHGRLAAEPGKVIMTDVKRGKERVLVSSDIAGPVDETTTDRICQINPREAAIDGYPSSLSDSPATDLELLKSIINISRILHLPGLKTLVLDHHLARDYRYPALWQIVYRKAAELKKRFGTAAELKGEKSLVLEGLQNYGTTRYHRWQPVTADTARALLAKKVTEGKIAADWLTAFDRWVR